MKTCKRTVAMLLSILMLFSCVAVTASADNNTMGTASPITGTANSYLTSLDDVDWFVFTATANAMLKVTINHEERTEEGTFFDLCVYNEAAATTANESLASLTIASAGNEKSLAGSVSINKDAKYYIVVSTSNTAAVNVNYSLKVEEVGSEVGANESEVNDTFSSADEIVLGTVMNGALSTAGDVDYYYFNSAVNGTLNFTFTHEAYTGQIAPYFDVSIYDANQNVVTTLRSLGEDNAVSADAIKLTAGKYYVKVNHSSVVTAIPYTINVNVDATGAIREVENNNEPARANKIHFSTNILGSLSGGDSRDCYFFTLEKKSTIDITFTHSVSTASNKNNSYFVVELLNSLEYPIQTFESRGVDEKMSRRVTLDEGKYYIRVREGLSLSEIEYCLRVVADAYAGAETEDNGDITKATSMVVNRGLYAADLKENTDIDFFVFNIDNNGYININFVNENPEVATAYKVSLCTETPGAGVVTTLDIHTFVVDENDTSFYSPIVGLEAGKYYLKVECATKPNNAYIYDGGAYSISVKYSNYSACETEPNNVYTKADKLELNTAALGSLFDPTDLDFYKFTYDSKKDFVFNVAPYTTTATKTGEWKAYLYATDAAGNMITPARTSFAFDSTGAKAYQISASTARKQGLISGTYYIKVVFDGGQAEYFSSQPYTISITNKEPTTILSGLAAFIARLKNIDWSNFWAQFAFVKNFDATKVIAALRGAISSLVNIFKYIRENR